MLGSDRIDVALEPDVVRLPLPEAATYLSFLILDSV